VGLIEGGAGVNAIAQAAARQNRHPLGKQPEEDELVGALEQAVGARAGNRETQRRFGRPGYLAAQGDRLAAGGGHWPTMRPSSNISGSGTAHLGIRSRLDCASTDANIPLSLGTAGHRHRRGRRGRRGAHVAGVVPAGRARPGLKRIFLLMLLLLGPQLPEPGSDGR